VNYKKVLVAAVRFNSQLPTTNILQETALKFHYLAANNGQGQYQYGGDEMSFDFLTCAAEHCYRVRILHDGRPLHLLRVPVTP